MIAHLIGIFDSKPYVNLGGDPAFANVGLLSEFTQYSLPDLSDLGQTMDIIGAVRRRTPAPKYGTAYVNCRGGNDGLVRANNNTAMAVGSGDFTIEFWIKRDTPPANTDRLAGRYSTSGTTNRGYFFGYTTAGTGVLNFSVANAAGSAVAGTASFRFGTDGVANIFDGTWHHVAAVRSGTTIKIYVDGVVGGVVYTIGTNAIAQSAGTYFTIGGTQGITLTTYDSPTTNTEFDDVRFTLGVARYTATFTPPGVHGLNVTDDPDFASVVLLLNFEEWFSFFAAGTYSTDLLPRSQVAAGLVPFDSNGLRRNAGYNSSLFFPTAPEFNLGASDFTYEVFGVYFDGSIANTAIAGCWASATGKRAWRLTRRATTTLGFSYTTDGTTIVHLDFTFTFANTTPYNVAMVRSGSTLYLYVNGTLTDTHALSATIFDAYTAALPLTVLAGMDDALTAYSADAAPSGTRVKGIRLTNNSARYTGSSYTVPSLPLPKS
jgi:hypothetical protein